MGLLERFRARLGPRDRSWRVQAIRDGRNLRLLGTLVIVAVLPFVPGMDLGSRAALAAVLVANHLVSTSVEKVGERHPGLPVTLMTSSLGLATIFVASLLAPMGKIAALFAVVIIVAYFASVDGRAVALGISTVALGLTVLREVLDGSGPRLDVLSVAVFGICLVTISLLVDGLTRQRLRTAANLERLHEALASVTSVPDLGPTLDSVGGSARRALRAEAVAILLREGDHLRMAAPSHGHDFWSHELVVRSTRAELATVDQTPLAVSYHRCETVVVGAIATDPRFPEWSREWSPAMHEFGFRSLVVVPLRIGDEVLGVVQAMFGRRAITRSRIALLEAYAEQSALLIARAQAFEKEKELAQRLAEADRLKSEFLALVSHELRTPLTAAKGFVDTVLLQWERLDDDRRRELLERASANADELTRLIEQLLDYTRIEGDWAPLDPRPLPLDAAVGAVLDHLDPVLAGHEVVADIPAELVAEADGDALDHVLTNILANAAKFAPSGTITVTAVADDGEIVVSVADEGPGIALDARERVFERFYQGDPAASAARRGAGLGLAIARRYVELHHGRIWVDSEPGEGATFSFTLPAQAPSPAGAGRSGASGPDGDGPGDETVRPAGSGGLTGRSAPPRIDQPV